VPPRFLRKHARLRLLPLYLAVLALWAVARPSAWSLAVGGLLVAAGLALRAWGAGHLVKTDRLAASGPYARLRHPLYAGSLLVGLGLGASAGGVALAAVASAGLPFFLLYYLPYKERIESARLERRHGAAYAEYRARVPALLPGPAFRGAGAERWSPARYRANHEAGTAVAVLATLAAIALRPVLPP
jgi:protein-S-isoprenylcysteine O-methyltransferase Ste14